MCGAFTLESPIGANACSLWSTFKLPPPLLALRLVFLLYATIPLVYNYTTCIYTEIYVWRFPVESPIGANTCSLWSSFKLPPPLYTTIPLVYNYTTCIQLYNGSSAASAMTRRSKLAHSAASWRPRRCAAGSTAYSGLLA